MAICSCVCNPSGGEANLDNLTKMLDAIGCYEGAEICKERGLCSAYMHISSRIVVYHGLS